jgi:sulfide:quinone oxidoreductase
MSDARPEILIAGSGPGALEAALALSRNAKLNAAVTLISPQTTFHYRPNFVMEPFGVSHTARYSVGEIIRHPNVEQWQGTIDRVDPASGRAYSPEGDEFTFDALVVATGTEPVVELPPPAITLGRRGWLDAVKDVVTEIDAGALRNIVFTIADGPTWKLPVYELALMTADRAERRSDQQVDVSLITPEDEPLAIFGETNSRAAAALCDEFGVRLRTGRTASAFDGGEIELNDGTRFAADRVLTMPRLRGVAPSGLPAGEDGFLPVDQHQLVNETTNVWAVGDVTDFRVKQGGLASEQADAAVRAIEAHLTGGGPAEPFVHEIEAVLLTPNRRVSMRARLGDRTSESLPPEQLEGPAAKIHGRLLTDRLREVAEL